MTSGYIPPEGQPDSDDILAALEEALNDDPRLAEMPEEVVARQLAVNGYLQDEPSPPLVAEALRVIETGKGNPT